MKLTIIIIITAVLTLFTACSVKDSENDNGTTDTVTTEVSKNEESFMNISAEKAKEIMDTETGYLILDVRQQSEYDAGHIEGAKLIPDNEIAKRAEKELPDKDQMILVYCRSGRRSSNAAAILAKLGYTNVFNFGGILDWKYGTVK